MFQGSVLDCLFAAKRLKSHTFCEWGVAFYVEEGGFRKNGGGCKFHAVIDVTINSERMADRYRGRVDTDSVKVTP